MVKWSTKDFMFSIGESKGNSTIIGYTPIIEGYNKSNNPVYKKGYILFCNKYKASYKQSESNFKTSRYSPYERGLKVCKFNSLNYLRPDLKKHLVNKQEGDNIVLNSSKKLKCFCHRCSEEKYITAKQLNKNGFICLKCRIKMSYPELLFMSYLEVKNIKYEYQYRLSNGRWVDFYIPDYKNKPYFIETCGKQHYEVSGYFKSEQSKKSDELKIKYANEHGIKILFIDCKESKFNYIINSIKTTELPKITEEDKNNIIKIIEQKDKINKSVNLEIVRGYKQGKTSTQLAKEKSMTKENVLNILKKYDVKRREDNKYKEKEVVCLNNKQVFKNIQKASKWSGANPKGYISNCCKGKVESAGFFNGEPAKWKYLTDYVKQSSCLGLWSDIN